MQRVATCATRNAQRCAISIRRCYFRGSLIMPQRIPEPRCDARAPVTPTRQAPVPTRSRSWRRGRATNGEWGGGCGCGRALGLGSFFWLFRKWQRFGGCFRICSEAVAKLCAQISGCVLTPVCVYVCVCLCLSLSLCVCVLWSTLSSQPQSEPNENHNF